MARGKKPIQVDPADLQVIITLLETERKFPSRSALWQAIETGEWAKSRQPRPLTGQIAMLIARKNNLSITTPIGKRGMEKGQHPPIAPGQRKGKPMPDNVRVSLLMATPKLLHGLVEKAAAGSRKAAIHLKCLDCSCGSKKSVALCPIKDCPLWHFRPYKGEKYAKLPDSSV